jgi:hypothetical protein
VTWRQHTIVLMVVVAASVALAAFAVTQRGRTVSTVACYLALSNDLTPLIEIGMPDTAAAGPECAGARGRDVYWNRSTSKDDTGEPALPQDERT